MFKQGNILHVQGIHFPVLVVTSDIYNDSGQAIVCPILKEEIPGPTTYVLSGIGTVMCDQVRFVDLNSRTYRIKSEISINDLIEISSIIESLFDYF